MSRYIAEMMSEITNHVMGKASGQLIRYEGNCSTLGSKNVYIGYNDNFMSVLSQFELVMTIICGAFLLLHAVSAWLLSKKNPYGGKLFWFFKF